MLGAKTGTDPGSFIVRAQAAYAAALGPDERELRIAGVERAVHRFALPGHEDLMPQLVTMLFRLLDEDRNGVVTLKEFVLGQALLYAAAIAKSTVELDELCWRALDIDGDGSVSRMELQEAVHLMLQLGAVRHKDIQQPVLAASRGPSEQSRRRVGQPRTEEELVDYYMEMYCASGPGGRISRAEFARHEALRENFWLLLTSPPFKAVFLAQDPSSVEYSYGIRARPGTYLRPE